MLQPPLTIVIKLKTTRDDAREIEQHFFPYIIAVCKMKTRQSHTAQEKMNTRTVTCIAQQVKTKYEKKLNSKANSFTIRFTDAEACTFYQLLLNFPVSDRRPAMVVLRQRIVNYLFEELNLGNYIAIVRV